MSSSRESFKRFAILYTYFNLFFLILLLVAIGGLSWFLTKQPQYAIPAMAFPFLLLILEIWHLMQIHASELSARKNRAITFHPDEQVTDYIAGLHSTGWWIRQRALFRGNNSIVFVNAMVLTNRQILLVWVPLDGAELLLARFGPKPKPSRDDVEGRLREMLAVEGMEAIPSQYAIPYENIVAVKLSPSLRRVKIVTRNGVFGYKVWEKRDFAKATELLARFRKSTAE